TYDGFVTKLSVSGSALAYSTYLGGAFFDRVNAIAVTSGQATVVGYTESVNFPTASPFQRSHGGGADDAFVTTVASGGGAPPSPPRPGAPPPMTTPTASSPRITPPSWLAPPAR